MSEPRPVGHPSTTTGAQLLRATPVVAGLVLGAGMATRGGATGWLGIALLVLSLLSVALTPRAWWQYVRTGVRPLVQVDPRLAEPGPHAVVLEATGERRIEVVKAVREVTGLGLADAKAVVDRTPSEVVAGLSEDSAARVRARLEQAGATASVS